MLAWRPHRWQWFLSAAMLAGASCALTNDEAPAGAPSIPTETPTSAENAPHAGPRAIRCNRCHSEEDRNAPHWKEIAKKIGHDVETNLETRTTCNCCHLGEVKGFGEPIDRQCVQCHDNVRVTITGMGQMHCLSCHDPSSVGGTLIRESAWECQKCHAEKQGNRLAIDVHGSEDCTECHKPHEEPWTLPRKCTDCHASNATHHGEKEGASPCVVCHRPHEISGAAEIRCQQCHDQQKPGAFAQATFAQGHSCQSCHDAHAAPDAPPRACHSCHSNLHTMSGRGSEKHAACDSCHSPHDVRKNPIQACNSCHATIAPKHPDPQGKTCIACHDPHPEETSTRATIACNECHDKAANETAFHAGNIQCKNCHVPHAFDKASVLGCAQCHEKESKASRTGHGHNDCAQCHAAHTPKAKPPVCAQCHAAEHLTAPNGHLNCTSCHDNHPTNRSAKQTCANCHQKKTTGPHENKDCSTCHRAHGPDAPKGPPGPGQTPTCSGCHPMNQLVSLHVIPQHQACSDCHRAHEAPKSDRATCMSSCHTDKRNHEPMARTCQGCHAFRPLR